MFAAIVGNQNAHTGAADDRNEQFIHQLTPRNINVSSGQQRLHVKVRKGCLDPPKCRLCEEDSRNHNRHAVVTRQSGVRGSDKWKGGNYQLYTQWARKNKHHHVFTMLHRLWTKASHCQSGGSRQRVPAVAIETTRVHLVHNFNICGVAGIQVPIITGRVVKLS